MSTRLPRVGLLVLAISEGVLGGWALFAPRSFYDSFPGGGHAWVSANGPYNQHLITDAGGLWLALTLVLLVAAWMADARVRVLAAGAFLVSAVPHLIFHLGHQGTLSSGDQRASIAVQVVTLLIALGVLLYSIKEIRT